jgi:hypothetical protein
MRVAVIQMNPGHDKAANIAQARRLIEAAVAAERPDIVALPEVWTCLGGDRAGKFAAAEALPAPGANEPGGEAYEFLRGMARTHRITVHGGSIGEAAGERLFNTTLAFGPEGDELARYRKVHLFDITTPDGTGYRESAPMAGARHRDLPGGGGDGRLRHLLRHPLRRSCSWRCGAGRGRDPRALQLHPADRQGPLGAAADPGACDRDPVLDASPPLHRPVPRARAAALDLWAFAGVRPLGACRRPRLDGHRAGRRRGSTRTSPRESGATCR